MGWAAESKTIAARPGAGACGRVVGAIEHAPQHDSEGGEPSDAEEPSQAQDADADEVHEGAAATDEGRFAQLLRLAR